jgi:hypothetical protein
MGVSSFLIGYIEEAWPGVAAGGDEAVLAHLEEAHRTLGRHNDAALQALPEQDEFPPLCRSMFGWPPAGAAMITYRNRLIHFAASMKEVDWYLRDWLDKFEALLRRLYWESAYARVETAYLGPHEFRWRPASEWVESLCKGRLTPIEKWSFTSTMDARALDRLREQAQ